MCPSAVRTDTVRRPPWQRQEPDFGGGAQNSAPLLSHPATWAMPPWRCTTLDRSSRWPLNALCACSAIFQLMPRSAAAGLLSPPLRWVDFPQRLSGRALFGSPHLSGTPSIIMSPDHCPWIQISSMVPFGDARSCGKIGRGRSLRSTQLGAASPKISLIRGADGGAAQCCYEHEGPTLFHPCLVPAGDRVHVIGCVGRVLRMEEVDDGELVAERIAALDLGKTGLEACVRVPSPSRPGRRMQELRGYGTTTAQLLEIVGWLRRGKSSGW